MKELTIEQKAQRYDEAIERANNILRGKCKNVFVYNHYNQGLIEYLFSELKESEDERIRKTLHEIVFQWGNGHQAWTSDKEEIAKILAWLEKQGENNMGISEATKQELEDNLNKALEKETPESWNKFLDEQKPVEEYNITGIGSKNAQGKLGEMIKNLKPVNEVLEQKPWSEGDEKILNLIIARLHSHSNVEVEEYGKGYHWLKSLKDRVQPKQEWSDVDKDILFHIIDDLKFLRDTVSIDPKYAVNIIDIEREITWLKSLEDRYTWKPSEEQMENLSRACNGGTYRTSLLMALYQDLKKLKGE